MRVIDISTFQGTPNFDEVKNHVGGVMIRASYGNGFAAPGGPNQYKDVQFDRNRNECRRLGIPRGFYHYSYPQYNSPEAEADYFAWVVGDLQKGELLALDFEEQYSGDKVDWCFRFLERLKQKYGFKPLLYINLSTARGNNWSKVIQGDYGLWVALWDGNTSMPATPWPVVAMKQYSSTGSIPGIAGNVDMNEFNGDVNLFLKYGFNPAPVPTPIPEPTPIPTPVPTPEPTPEPDKLVFRVSIVGPNANEAEKYDTKEKAQDTYDQLLKSLLGGETISLDKVNDKTDEVVEHIISYTKPMEPVPAQSVTIESLKDRLANSFSYAIPVQGITAALGVIYSYQHPDMPFEVISAYTFLFGVVVNVGFAAARFLAEKLTVTKTTVTTRVQ